MFHICRIIYLMSEKFSKALHPCTFCLFCSTNKMRRARGWTSTSWIGIRHIATIAIIYFVHYMMTVFMVEDIPIVHGTPWNTNPVVGAII